MSGAGSTKATTGAPGGANPKEKKKKKHEQKQNLSERAPARPSASVILVSPDGEILLLHRVSTSSTFPSAHVFPGGNIDGQDGHMPSHGRARHQDNPAYRVGALRELFEESGILLARKHGGGEGAGEGEGGGGKPELVSLPQTTLDQGRRIVHSNAMPLQTWLDQTCPNATLDTDSLIPFSRWITPAQVPRRFTTQMYLYFLPSSSSSSPPSSSSSSPSSPSPSPPSPSSPSINNASLSFTASSDNGLEHSAASFAPAASWLRRAQLGEVILFPPQFLLLHLVSSYLDDETVPRGQRGQRLVRGLVHAQPVDGTVPWGAKCISPYPLGLAGGGDDGRVVLALDRAGLEMETETEEVMNGTARGTMLGDRERVVLVRWEEGGAPREVEVRWRKDVMLSNGGKWKL